MCQVYAGGATSGAHYNPAVTCRGRLKAPPTLASSWYYPNELSATDSLYHNQSPPDSTANVANTGDTRGAWYAQQCHGWLL